MGIGDDVQEFLLDKISSTKTKTPTRFIETDWNTQRKAIVAQLSSAGRGVTPNYGWMFHEILVAIDSAKHLLADEEIIRLLSIHLSTASDANLHQYNKETRALAIFLVGFFNCTLNSPESDKVLQVLSRQKQGFLPFLVKHVEPQVLAAEIPAGSKYKPVYPETPAYNFLQFFVELTKPQQLHLALAQALCEGCQSYVAAYMIDSQQAYVASLFMLLLSYVETISDELTTVGEKAAAYFDSLAPYIAKLLNNTSYYELSLNLLIVILRKYTTKRKALEWLPNISKTLVTYITAIFPGKSAVSAPAAAYAPPFPQQWLVLIAELLIPLLQYPSMRDLLKKNEVVDVILHLTLQQGKHLLFFNVGVAFIRELVAANCAATLISESFVKQVIVRMRSPCTHHAHFKEIACILFMVREFSKLFSKADAAFATAAPKSIDATKLVNLSKEIAKASKEIQQLELENEIADMDGDMMCTELENEVSQLKLRSRAIRAIWHTKKNSLFQKIEKEEQEKTTRENSLLQLLVQIAAEVKRNEEQEKARAREQERERAIEHEAALKKEREQKLAQERQDRDRLERERKEKVRFDREQQEEARLAHERLEREQREIERCERELKELERRERELQDRERQERERLERERQERERLERERLEREQQERERQEQERQAREQAIAQYQERYEWEQYTTERVQIEFRGPDNQMFVTIEQEIALKLEDSPMDEVYNPIATQGEEEILRQQREADQARNRMHVDGKRKRDA